MPIHACAAVASTASVENIFIGMLRKNAAERFELTFGLARKKPSDAQHVQRDDHRRNALNDEV